MNTRAVLFMTCSLFAMSTMAQADSFAKAQLDTNQMIGISFVSRKHSRKATELKPSGSEMKGHKKGGLNLKRYFGNYSAGTLCPCGDAIYSTLDSWVRQNSMIISSDDASNSKIDLSIWEPNQEGLFKFYYRVREDGSYAELWVNYHTLSGETVPPESIDRLRNSYKLMELYDQLKKSIKCSEK